MKYNPTLHKLSNGVTVILDPMDLETTNIKVRFNTGSRDEAPEQYGLTHFCEHMLGKGSANFPTKKFIDDYMDYYGATRNASTGISQMNTYGRVLGENVSKLIDFFSDVIQNSLFDAGKIEIERTVICDEYRRARDDESREYVEFLWNKIMGVPMYRTLGSIENIMSFTRDQMLDWMAQRLSAKNCMIGISGRIDDADAVLKQLEQRFAFLPTHEVSENKEINATPGIYHNSKQEKQNVKLEILFPEIWDNTFENIVNEMAVSRFERYMIRKISDILRQENGLVYGFSGAGLGVENTRFTGFATQTSTENLKQVVALIAKNAYKIYNNLDMTEADLDRYNRKDRLGDADWLENAGRRCDKLLSFYYSFGRVYDFYEIVRQCDAITVADVQEKIRGYFEGPISIVTQGADFDIDLKSVWNENFK